MVIILVQAISLFNPLLFLSTSLTKVSPRTFCCMYCSKLSHPAHLTASTTPPLPLINPLHANLHPPNTGQKIIHKVVVA